MIDKEKAAATVGEGGFELYERILDQVQRFEGIGSSGRIGAKLSISYRIRGKGSVYIDIHRDGVDMQLGSRLYEKIPFSSCLAELDKFLKS
jgi:hypothetical protein